MHSSGLFAFLSFPFLFGKRALGPPGAEKQKLRLKGLTTDGTDNMDKTGNGKRERLQEFIREIRAKNPTKEKEKGSTHWHFAFLKLTSAPVVSWLGYIFMFVLQAFEIPGNL